jgi:hypothetical protein
LLPFGTIVRSAIGRVGFGYLPDRDVAEDRVRDFQTVSLGMAVGDVSLAQHCGTVLNQGATSSCVAHAILDAELTTLKARYGLKAELGSRNTFYFLARSRDGMQGTDRGCRPSAALQALEKYGIGPESAWPFVLANLNKQPPWRVLWDARGRRGVRGTYKIHETGDRRVEAIRSALKSGRALAFGVSIDQAFTEKRGPGTIQWSVGGKTVGRHMMEVVGLRYIDGSDHILVKNSWGTGWRDGGYAWLDRGYIDAGTDWVCVDPEGPAE